ncbi:MAG TPA: hypothetical protein VMJ10_30705 [Kofleriaceae bacterium]|nr:hypothetical protein [Kofleriaceae bacterium]
MSFAVSRDGRTLATGSEASFETDYDAPTVGVVLWDLSSLTVQHRVPVRGGVGLSDQLKRGLQFSSSGELLGVNFHTCAVGAIDVATGQLVLEWDSMGWDFAPTYCISDDDRQLFFGWGGDHCSDDSVGLIAPARGGVVHKPACVPGGSGRGHLSAVSFRSGVVHGVTETHELISLDVRRGAVVRTLPLFLGARPDAEGFLTLTPSPSGRYLFASAIDRASGKPTLPGTHVLDLDTGVRVFEDDRLTNIAGFAIAASEHRWAAIGSNRALSIGAPDWIALFEHGRPIGRIEGPLEKRDWLRFADGLPFCFSPDGREGLVLRPGGTLELWDLAGAPRRMCTLGEVPDVRGVAWPQPGLALAIGPGILTFLDISLGAPRAWHTFPG